MAAALTLDWSFWPAMAGQKLQSRVRAAAIISARAASSAAAPERGRSSRVHSRRSRKAVPNTTAAVSPARAASISMADSPSPVFRNR